MMMPISATLKENLKTCPSETVSTFFDSKSGRNILTLIFPKVRTTTHTYSVFGISDCGFTARCGPYTIGKKTCVIGQAAFPHPTCETFFDYRKRSCREASLITGCVTQTLKGKEHETHVD